MKRVPLLLVTVMLVSSPVFAQGHWRNRESPNIERERTLGEAVSGIASSVEHSEEGDKQRTDVIWLLDYTSRVRNKELFRILAREIRNAFETKEGIFQHTRHTLLLLGDKIELLLQRTRNASNISTTLESVQDQKEPSNKIKNLFKRIQQTAKVYGKLPGSKKLVLFSLMNGDTEYKTEKTARMLYKRGFTFHAISREAILSDSFWQRPKSPDKKDKLNYGGPASPRYEFPWGWNMQNSIITNVTPSGYGIYGLQHLANATGGTYHVYFPDQYFPVFCESVKCPLCDGTHMKCHRPYNFTLMRGFTPWVGSRKKYDQIMANSNLAKTYFSVWSKAYKHGLVKNGPPLQPGTTKKWKLDHGKRKHLNFTNWPDEKTLHERAKHAKKMLPKINPLIKRLEPIHKKDALDYGLARIAAFAKLMDIMLRVTRFNLKQFIRFEKFITKVEQLNGVPEELSFLLPFAPGGKKNYIYISKNYTYCHGPDRVETVSFMGGKKAEKELKDINEYVREFLDEFQQTPWALALRRIGPVKFMTWPKTGGSKKRKYPLSAQGSEETESGGEEENERPDQAPGSKGAGTTGTGN